MRADSLSRFQQTATLGSGRFLKAGHLLADCGIAHSKTLGGLTEWQWTEPLRRFRRGRDK
jgi:hypothetical protein